MTGRTALGSWCTNPPKNYPRYRTGPCRNRYVHRVVFESTAGRPVREGYHVAHQDHDKLNFQPENLLECPPEFNPAVSLRCPYTGQFLSRATYERRMGC
jgi:hypothetical protein